MTDRSETDLYNYIIIIDAGSKGSRAYLYKSKIPIDEFAARDWKADDDIESITSKGKDIPLIELVKTKKVKPGIADLVDKPNELDGHYIGKLLESMEDHVPHDQIKRTPIFLHATGGMRLLRPEQQTKTLDHICNYIKKHSEFYLPDCNSHINAVSGETEGLYAWIGLNYRNGVFDTKSEDSSSFGVLDMGGTSSQLAFEPSDAHNNTDFLFKLNLNYHDNDTNSLNYNVFSQTLLSGIHQAHLKYDESLLAKNQQKDPCLPSNYVKTITSRDGIKSTIEGSGDFAECLISLYEILEETSVDKYCDPSDKSTTSSCLLSDEIPKMDLSYQKFIGINEIYSNLKKGVNYKTFYEDTKRICQLSYAELLQEKAFDKNDISKTSEICFKSSWVINVLHHGVDFPRFGIDDVEDSKTVETKLDSVNQNFKILDDYSWTLGRAVLYIYYEVAQSLQNISDPKIGYYEPSSDIFIPGGEALGVPLRPGFDSISNYKSGHGDDDYDDKDHKNDDKHEHDHDDDDDDDDDNDWDDVLEEHRLWGSLIFLLLLLVVGYLLMGRTKRQSIKDTFKRLFQRVFKSNSSAYSPVTISVEDLELGDLDNISGRSKSSGRGDSFDISE